MTITRFIHTAFIIAMILCVSLQAGEGQNSHTMDNDQDSPLLGDYTGDGRIHTDDFLIVRSLWYAASDSGFIAPDKVLGPVKPSANVPFTSDDREKASSFDHHDLAVFKTMWHWSREHETADVPPLSESAHSSLKLSSPRYSRQGRVTVDLNFSGDETFSAAELFLVFNSDTLRYLSFTPGELLASESRKPVVLEKPHDTHTLLVLSTLADVPPGIIESEGVLGTFEFSLIEEYSEFVFDLGYRLFDSAGTVAEKGLLPLAQYPDYVHEENESFVMIGPNPATPAENMFGMNFSGDRDVNYSEGTVFIVYPGQINPPYTVSVTVYDYLGNPVIENNKTYGSAGEHIIYWDCRNASGRALPSGSYKIVTEIHNTESSQTLKKVLGIQENR
ncbi:MAG: hypothetical protein ACQEQ4_07345 [Fibrobacterota bacterium]